MSVPDNIRQELIRLCGRSGTRKSVFSRALPTHWEPAQAYDPGTGNPFTPNGAWAHVTALLQGGCELEAVALERPPGKTGYVLRFEDHRGTRIYVKLQIVSGMVIGRSFHQG